MKKIDDIEILRAIAIVFVLIQHLPFVLFSWLPIPSLTPRFSFAVGVDLFFAVSGFVIARTLLPTLQSAKSSLEVTGLLAAFWVRRAWRLWPAAWAWLILILVFTFFYNHSNVFGSLHANLEATVAGFLHVANFRFKETVLVREYGVSFYYWSLSMEEQFYLLLPIAALLARKWLWLVILAVIALRFAFGSHMSVFRIEVMAIGVLAAIAMAKEATQLLEPKFLECKITCFIVLGATLVCLVLLGGGGNHIVPLTQQLVTILCGLLIFAAAFNRDYFRLPGLLHPCLLWVGSRSYALYLAHIPAYYLSREIWFRAGITTPDSTNTLRFALTAILLLSFFAEATYRLIETPSRNYGARIAQAIRAKSSAPPA